MYDVVIPARNEVATIKPIVETFRAHPFIRRIVVCVDWDTADNTALMARSPASLVIHDSSMKGKGQCVDAGLTYVETDQVIFSDADYRGLCLTHIDRLVIGHSRADMVIGIPDFPKLDKIPQQFRGRIEYAWPWTSGIRVVDTDIVRRLQLTGYLMETQINKAIHDAGKVVKFIRLPGLVSPFNMTPQRLAEMERDRSIGQQKGILP